MSRYTITVEEICKELAYSVTNNPNILISEASPIIFDFDIDLGISHKWELLNKVLRRYYFNEICCETLGMWQLLLHDKCDEIEQKYRSLYAAEKLNINKFANYSKKEEFNLNSNTTDSGESLEYTQGQSTSEGVNNEINAYSDTPEGKLSGVEELNYLSSATKVEAESKDTVTSDTNRNSQDNHTSDKNETHTSTIEALDGIIGYKALKDYTENVLEIDRMYINEFKDLFMSIF